MKETNKTTAPPSEPATLGLGLWGSNGHQIHQVLDRYPRLRLVAFGAFDTEDSQTLQSRSPEARLCKTFEAFLALPGLDFVSLCSPLRTEQAAHTIAALEAGLHVYAEKPCATTEPDLDRVLAAVDRSTATFHEMGGTAFEQPYWAMREIIADGALGKVVQVSAQKSYPFYDGRPTSEAVDGGMVAQSGVHALRFIEHVAGVRAVTIEAVDTQFGEARAGSDLKMAASMMGTLENGGVFSVVANYLNPTGFGTWGNEMLRVFGTKGLLESVDGGTRTRLVVGDDDRGAIDTSNPAPDWLDLVIAHAADGQPVPFDLETELHPTRMVLRARADAERKREGNV